MEGCENLSFKVENVATYSPVYLYKWRMGELTANVGGWVANREHIDFEADKTKELVQTITIRPDVEPSTETGLG